MALLDTVDPEGLDEFSVVFTDRSLNSMSQGFQGVMRDLHEGLCDVYKADHVAIIPGGGTFGMEAVARQFGQGARALVVRNGWFSYRWSQILEAGAFSDGVEVIKARQSGNDSRSPFAPAPIEEVVARIRDTKPDVVFAPHVETSAGVILPDTYITALAEAAHEVGGLLVLDCIASGCVWVDMRATMPTDALRHFRDTLMETQKYGFARLKSAQWELGDKVRAMFAAKGVTSVAAEGFGAPGVVVCYAPSEEVKTGKAFMAHGMQIAAGVPLQCDEPADFATFRIGLFGLDKLMDVDGTVNRLKRVVDQVFPV